MVKTDNDNNNDNDDELTSSQDFIMTEGFQKDTNESSNADVWLIMGNSPVKTNDEGTRWCKGGAALVSSAKKRDEFIDRHKGSFFKNGYTVTRASNMQELRDELGTILRVVLPPPPRQEKEIQIQSRTIIHATDPAGLDEIKRFELFRSVIQHEDDLLNQRVSWIILAQSFLMAAFITSSGPNSLRYVTAIVGLATVVVTMPAIVAAGKNIEVQQEVYFKMLLSDERSKELHGHQRDLIKEKDESTRRIEHGHLLPTMAFRGRGAVRILKTVVVLAAVQFFGWVFLLLALILDM